MRSTVVILPAEGHKPGPPGTPGAGVHAGSAPFLVPSRTPTNQGQLEDREPCQGQAGLPTLTPQLSRALGDMGQPHRGDPLQGWWWPQCWLPSGLGLGLWEQYSCPSALGLWAHSGSHSPRHLEGVHTGFFEKTWRAALKQYGYLGLHRC